MKTLLAVLLAGMAASGAVAAPKAESAMECGIAADMAVVARSLAAERIQRPQAGSIMARIYDVTDSTRGQELMRDIIDAAYRDNGGDDSAGAGGSASEDSQKFAEDLFATCMKSGGNMDPVLGKRL